MQQAWAVKHNTTSHQPLPPAAVPLRRGRSSSRHYGTRGYSRLGACSVLSVLVLCCFVLWAVATPAPLGRRVAAFAVCSAALEMAEALVNQRDDAAQHHRLRRHQRHLHLRSGNTRLQAGASECRMRLSGRQAHRHTGGLAGRQTRSIVSIAAATALLHDFDGCWIDLPDPSARSNRRERPCASAHLT